jgi:hypothetical protein
VEVLLYESSSLLSLHTSRTDSMSLHRTYMETCVMGKNSVSTLPICYSLQLWMVMCKVIQWETRNTFRIFAWVKRNWGNNRLLSPLGYKPRSKLESEEVLKQPLKGQLDLNRNCKKLTWTSILNNPTNGGYWLLFL